MALRPNFVRPALLAVISLGVFTACPPERKPAESVPAVAVDGAEPQDTPIPTGDAGDAARPQIVGLTAPASVRPGQIVTLRLVTDYPFVEDLTGIAIVIEGVEGWLLAEANPVPGTVSDPGPWVLSVTVTVAEAFDENAVARVSVALLGPGLLAGAYQNWVPVLDEEADPVACPADGDCSALSCGPDPVCSTSCGTCSPDASCNAAGACEMIGSACPDAADCSGRVCGFDPVCGLECGSCGPGESCAGDGSACVSSQMRVVESLSAGVTRSHTCAVFDDATVGCWGANGSGQLGLGDLDARGDQPDELGANLQLADVGAPVQRVYAGEAHTCALTTAGTVRCWGEGDHGALGRGDVSTIGDQAGELPDDLVDVDLPLGTVSDLCLGDQFGCALDEAGAVACWGRNDFGQLGQGDIEDRGDQADELGTALSPVALDGSATQIACGRHHTCARVGGDLYCWGRNDWGQLGIGDAEHRGDGPDEMGAALPKAALGDGRTVRLLAVGSHHACVVLDDDAVKCWGQGFWGNVGLESDQVFGDTPGTTPDQLSALNLGTQSEIAELEAGDRHSCARFEDDEIRCWGYPWALGVGDSEGRGAAPNTMGDNLEAARLSGLSLAGLWGGGDFTCAMTTDGRVQCWGYGLSGQLGVGDTQTRGDEPGEMGSALPFAEL